MSELHLQFSPPVLIIIHQTETNEKYPKLFLNKSWFAYGAVHSKYRKPKKKNLLYLHRKRKKGTEGIDTYSTLAELTPNVKWGC